MRAVASPWMSRKSSTESDLRPRSGSSSSRPSATGVASPTSQSMRRAVSSHARRRIAGESPTANRMGVTEPMDQVPVTGDGVQEREPEGLRRRSRASPARPQSRPRDRRRRERGGAVSGCQESSRIGTGRERQAGGGALGHEINAPDHVRGLRGACGRACSDTWRRDEPTAPRPRRRRDRRRGPGPAPGRPPEKRNGPTSRAAGTQDRPVLIPWGNAAAVEVKAADASPSGAQACAVNAHVRDDEPRRRSDGRALHEPSARGRLGRRRDEFRALAQRSRDEERHDVSSLPAGSHTLELSLDDDGSVAESREDNNRFRVLYVLKPPCGPAAAGPKK